MTEHADYEIVDFNQWLEFDDRPPDGPVVGPARRVETEGRCTGCWGPIVGLTDRNGRVLRIECLGCGRSIAGKDAERELERMRHEVAENAPLARVGRGSRYDERARFVLKLLADMDRDKARFDQRAAASRQAPRRKNWLDRRDFPSGTAGHLFAQAGVLVAGLHNLPRRMSPVSLSDIEYGAPEDLRVEASAAGEPPSRVSWRIPGKYRDPSNAAKKARMGTAVIAGMTAAFACEVGMKAILLTRNHAAERTHDLARLYRALPADSRARLAADFPEIEDVLRENRHTFGKWRYFERKFNKNAFGALVDTDRVWGLGKSARVIVDECVVAGLDYRMRWTQDIEVKADGGEVAGSAVVHLRVDGDESAIAWHDPVLAGGREE